MLIGNICSLCAMATDSVSATRRKHGQILAIQTVSQVFYAAGSIILKGYSSTVQNAVAVLRNLAAIKHVRSKAIEWLLILLGIIPGIIFNNRAWLGLLPVVANAEYSVCMFRMRDNVRGLKLSLIVNVIMYAVFNVVIMNYVGAAACTVVCITTVISLIREKKTPSADKAAEDPITEQQEMR